MAQKERFGFAFEYSASSATVCIDLNLAGRGRLRDRRNFGVVVDRLVGEYHEAKAKLDRETGTFLISQDASGHRRQSK